MVRDAGSRVSVKNDVYLPLYVVVEKILGFQEAFPDDWPTHGTSGYDMHNQLNGLFIDPGPAEFTGATRNGSATTLPIAKSSASKKLLILNASWPANCTSWPTSLNGSHCATEGPVISRRTACGHALREVIALFPVYRSYITADDSQRAGPDARRSRHPGSRYAATR